MSYERMLIRAPRLSGRALEALVKLAESGAAGSLLRRRMLAELGVDKLRDLSMCEEPSPLPSRSAGGAKRSGARLKAPGATDLAPGSEDALEGTFRYADAADYEAAYLEGGTTPLEVAEALLECVGESESGPAPLRIFISQDRRELMELARASTRRYERGEHLGPLDGVPVAVKDELDQRGLPTTVGTSFLGRRPAAADATVVARLRASGALLAGKTNMHEIGLGVTGLNPHHGTARNPHDPARHTGGSSSGSAAAVASGICPISVGADGGGSIRIPAALCGIVGLKPTYGRMSAAGSAPLCWSVGTSGPMAVSARDAALAYMVMAGPDEDDPRTRGQPAPEAPDTRVADLGGMRLGVFPAWLEDADPGVVEVVQRALRGLEAAGANLHEIEIPELHLTRLAHMITIVAEMAASSMAERRRGRARHGLDVRLNLALSDGLTAADYVQAQRLRTRAMAHMDEVLSKVDGVLTPTTGCTAPLIAPDALRSGESNLVLLDRIMRFSPLANLTGLPSISFPVGYDEDGLPVGCQLIGRPWSEAFLLEVAAVAERLTPRRAPRFAADPLGRAST